MHRDDVNAVVFVILILIIIFGATLVDPKVLEAAR